MIDKRFLSALTVTVPVYGIFHPDSRNISEFNADLWVKLSNVAEISRKSGEDGEIFVVRARPEYVNPRELAEGEEWYVDYVTNEFTYDLIREVLG